MTHNEFVESVLARLTQDDLNMDTLRNALHISLQNLRLEYESQELVPVDQDRRGAILQKFLACKTIEGCANKTINYYRQVLVKMFGTVTKQVAGITTDDMRYYMALRMQRDKITKVTLDNERHVFMSFFGWAVENDVIIKSPMQTIKKVKTEKRVKKPFSDIEIEQLRIAAQGDKRLTAILELLLSTGMRVGELVRLNRDDVNGDEAIVFGKGAKERIVFLNARAQVALKIYEESRPDDDTNPALFSHLLRPYKRVEISCVEDTVREMGRKAGINDVHPHRFRRTAATMALSRGMPIDQVQQMLGHSQIATTLIYAQASYDTVKQAHKKLM